MSETFYRYLMQKLSNLIFNVSQSDRNQTDDILDSLKVILLMYNEHVSSGASVDISDFREGRNAK